ncbi:hypothetical protein J2S07_001588 [Robertmurraya andreesenii]|uniref:Uncharacterized protein n=1 Tax=Anoxybacillus andreesenii TaxID=1325932 RepID=A0ABT9V2V5_9BACL|nr:hypothetical protein [Robertmurraya andreesenii]
MPDEARQPSVVDTEMVPIHTKQILLWQMRERELVLLMPFCFSAGRHFCIIWYLVPLVDFLLDLSVWGGQ